MTTRITDRFSKIERLTDNIKPEDRVILTQQEGDIKKTVNATIDNVYTYIQDKFMVDGIGSIVNIGNGITGKGSGSDPVRLDPIWLDQTLVRRDRFSITRVGNRKTRYLPIARYSMVESTKFNSTVMRAPYVSTIEPTGELRIIQPASNAYTLSIGDWGSAGTVDSLQIIERKIKPNNLPDGYAVKGLLTKSKNSAILILGRLDNLENEEFWYASLKDGSLAEESYYNFTLLGSRNSTLGTLIANNSVACAQTEQGGRMFFVAMPNADKNAGIEIRGWTLGDPATVALAEFSSWNVSSYAGLLSGQNCIRVSEKFLGTAAQKCELTDTTNGAITVSALNSGNSITRVQCIHNPQVDSDLYLIVRREHLLTQNGVSKAYVHDIVLKLTADYRTGSGSAIAIPSYLTNRPTINASWEYTNKRETFRSSDLADTDSEMMSVLADGSVMLIGDTANGDEEGLIRVRKSPAGWGVMNMVDIDAAVKANKLGAEQIIDPKPSYVDASYTYKVYISSPISVYMNGADYTLPAQVVDLTNECAAATPTVLGDIPYSKGVYAGITARIVYLYLQQAGKVIQLVKTHQVIAESVSNTLLATAYFTNSTAPILLAGQAYSRMGKYRLSYVPMGSAAPVSYDHPAQYPKEFWVQRAMGGDGTPTFWGDPGATTTQLLYASNGRVIYIRVMFDARYVGRPFHIHFGGYSWPDKTFTGEPMIWQVTVSHTSPNPFQEAAVVIDGINGAEVSRSYITLTPYSFVTQVVGTEDGDDVITTTVNGSWCWARVMGYDLDIGDVFNVGVWNPQGNFIDLGNATYQGYPMFFAFHANMVGTFSIQTKNLTKNFQPANTTLSVAPAITYYTPGQYRINVPVGRTVKLTLVGSGGGGGGSIHNYSSSVYWESSNGKFGDLSSARFTVNPFGISRDLLLVYGGGGGKGANWGNGSSYSNGSPGTGGIIQRNNSPFSVIALTNGITPPIVDRWQRQPGGTSVAPEAPAGYNGAGGAGAWGVGDEKWSYGGGGGSGARFIGTFNNKYSDVVSFDLVVGAGGIGWKRTAVTNGNEGDDGAHGYAIVEFL